MDKYNRHNRFRHKKQSHGSIPTGVHGLKLWIWLLQPKCFVALCVQNIIRCCCRLSHRLSLEYLAFTIDIVCMPSTANCLFSSRTCFSYFCCPYFLLYAFNMSKVSIISHFSMQLRHPSGWTIWQSMISSNCCTKLHAACMTYVRALIVLLYSSYHILWKKNRAPPCLVC